MISRQTTTIRDPGLGIVPANAGNIQVKLGICNKGAPNTVYSAGGVTPAKDAVGSGPLLECAAQALQVGAASGLGGQCLLVPLTPSTYGTVTGGFALTGSGTGTVTGSKGPEQVVKVKIILGGTPGTMTFQVAIGSGAYSTTITSGSDPYTLQVTGQYLTKLAFGNVTYVLGDIYTLNLDGTVTRTGSGPATALDTSTHSPVDSYDIRVAITRAGALGAAAFKYSLDGANTYSAEIGVPAGGKYVIPGTGIVLTFAGTFVADDVYAGTATAASFGTSDVTAGFTALLASPLKWGFFHLVGPAATAAAAATLAAIVETQMLAAKAAFRYVRGVIECAQGESDSTIVGTTSLTSFVSEDGRVSIACGDGYVTSQLTGRKERRNGAWAATARYGATKLSSHPGQREGSNGGGALRNVTSLVRDEYKTPALDSIRLLTLQSDPDVSGYFVTDGMTMAQAGSDFSSFMNGRVMDRICVVARAAIGKYLNKDIRLNASGFIDERDAQDIEDEVKAALRSTVFADGDVSQPPECVVSRTDNILSTSTLTVDVSAIPKGYARIINTTLGFTNPALRAAAA
jgi:hypothetical protein